MSKLSVFVALSAAIAASTAGADDKIRATLMGFQEVPAVSTQATATFEAVISPNGDAIDYELTFSGLQAPIQQSHIHVGQRSVNGGIMIWLCGTGTTQPLAGLPARRPAHNPEQSGARFPRLTLHLQRRPQLSRLRRGNLMRSSPQYGPGWLT